MLKPWCTPWKLYGAVCKSKQLLLAAQVMDYFAIVFSSTSFLCCRSREAVNPEEHMPYLLQKVLLLAAQMTICTADTAEMDLMTFQSCRGHSKNC